MTKLRQIVEADRADWVRMRHALWPDESGSHDAETVKHFANPVQKIFVADIDGRLVGFLELGYRPYAEGCKSSPVPHLRITFRCRTRPPVTSSTRGNVII